MFDDDIRKDQQQHGARMGGTLRAKSGFGKKPQKTTPKGHEAFLKALESSGATVSFHKASCDEIITGTIKTSDKYTVSIQCDRTGMTRVMFKHDISEFCVEARPEAEVV